MHNQYKIRGITTLKTIFKAVADPIKSRLRLYDDIMDAVDSLPRNRVVSHIDVEYSFLLHGSRPATLGFLNTQQAAYRDNISQALIKRAEDGIFLDTLRSTRAKVLTSVNLRLHELRFAKEDKPQDSSDFVIFYLGDYMDAYENLAKMDVAIFLDVIAGYGESVLNTFHELRKIPDYSEYVSNNNHRPPPRPPRNQRKADKPVYAPVWTPA